MADLRRTRTRPAGAPRGSLERIYLSLGDRMGEALEREMLAGESLAPTRTAARTAATTIAVLIYVAALSVIAAGVIVIVIGWPHALPAILGAGLAGAGAICCPRPVRRARVRDGLAPASLPALSVLIARIAQTLEVRPPDLVRFAQQFNASWQHDGWRRRRVLTLGVPLLAALGPEATIALLAHELAHERNGDARRGRLVGSSLASLTSALDLLRRESTRRVSGLTWLGVLVANGALWLCRQPVRGLLLVQAHLLYRDSQRAEYLADDLAATVAGSDAAIELHDTLLAGPTVQMAVRRVSLTRDRVGASLLADLRAAASTADEAARTERRDRARAERRRLDSTHPTTASRIAVIATRPRRPAVVLNEAERNALDAELRAVLERHIPALIDLDRDRLYFR